MKYNKTGVYVRNGIIYIQGSHGGKFKRISTKKKATKENLTWAKKNAEDLFKKQLDIVDSKREPYLDEFGYKSLEINAHTRKENTNKDYKAIFERHILPYFKNYRLSDIKATDLKEWQTNLIKKQLSGKRIKNIRTVFRGIIQDAFIDEYIDLNPFDRVKNPTVKSPDIEPFNIDEVKELINTAEGWFRNYLIVAFFTGMRVGEIIALKWSDINFEKSTISIKLAVSKGLISTPKTKNSIRTIDMLSPVKKALISQKSITVEMQSFIFINDDKYFTDAYIIRKRFWLPLFKDIKIKYRVLYQTRHTFASIMLQQGEELAWVSEMMGHSDMHTTLTKYARFIPREHKIRAEFLEDIDLN